jgi:hypothetical protein
MHLYVVTHAWVATTTHKDELVPLIGIVRYHKHITLCSITMNHRREVIPLVGIALMTQICKPFVLLKSHKRLVWSLMKPGR